MNYCDKQFRAMQRAYDQMEPPEGYYGEDCEEDDPKGDEDD